MSENRRGGIFWLTLYNLRGHSMKVYVPRCVKTVRKTFCSFRVCNSRNSLPQHVIEAQSTNSFKNRLAKFWSDIMGAWKLLLQSSSTSIKYEVIRRTMTSFYGVLSRAMGSPTPYWTGFGRICQVEGNSFAAKVHDCRPFCWHAEFHRVRCSGQSRLSSSCTSPTRLHWVRSTVCLHINSLFDTQIYDSCLPSHIDEFSSKVSGYVNDVADWMRSNRLQINPEKYDTIR